MKRIMNISIIIFMLLFSSYAIIGFDSEDYDSQGHQLVVTVNDDYGPSTPGWGTISFDNIQEGISAVINNGIVFVHPGTYDGFNVNKPCKIIGLNKNLVIIDGNETGNVIIVNASNSILMNLNITGVDSSSKNVNWGTKSIFGDSGVFDVSICALNSTYIAIAYRDFGNNNYGTVRIASVSDTNLTWGAESVFNNHDPTSGSFICALNSTHIAVAYQKNESIGAVRIASVSGTTPTWGSESVFNNARTRAFSICALDNSHIAVAYNDTGNDNNCTVRIASVSGTTPTWGDESVFSDGTVDHFISICALNSTHIAVAYKNEENNDGTVRIASVSGTTPSWGIESVFNSYEPGGAWYISSCALDSSHIAVAYVELGGDSYGTVRIASVSGTTPSWGIESVFNNEFSTYPVICALDNSHIAVAYKRNVLGYDSVSIASVSGTTPNWGTKSVFNIGNAQHTCICALNSSHITVAYRDDSDNNNGTACIGHLGESEYSLLVINNTANSNTIQNCYFQYSDGGKVSLVGNGNNFLANTGSTVLLCNSSNNHIHNNTCFWRMLFTDSNNNTIEHNSHAPYEGNTKLDIDFRGSLSYNNVIKYNECNRIGLNNFSIGYVLNNICHNSTYGIFLNGSSDNTIYGNVLENCNYGVYIE